jgi:hypothetical protein
MKKINILIIISALNILFIVKTVKAQEDKKFNLYIGANICNPHQLIEGSSNFTDINSLKAFGNITLGVSYKNKIQINVSNELNEFNGYNYLINDFNLNLRYFILKEKLITPYIELGTLLGSVGSSTSNVINQKSICYELGLIGKINNIVSYNFSVNYQLREINITVGSLSTGNKEEINIDRFMVRTGLIFKLK